MFIKVNDKWPLVAPMFGTPHILMPTKFSAVWAYTPYREVCELTDGESDGHR